MSALSWLSTFRIQNGVVHYPQTGARILLDASLVRGVLAWLCYYVPIRIAAAVRRAIRPGPRLWFTPHQPPPLEAHPLVKHYGLPLEKLALTKAHRQVEGSHRRAAWAAILEHVAPMRRGAVVRTMGDALGLWLEYRDAVTIVRDRVQDLIQQGKTLAQVKAADPTLGYRSQYGADKGSWTTDMFVETIFNELSKKK